MSGSIRAYYHEKDVPGLPEPRKNGRWMPSDKARVVDALLNFEEGPDREFAITVAARKYAGSGTSEEEIKGWIRLAELDGVNGLRVTRTQTYTPPEERDLSGPECG